MTFYSVSGHVSRLMAEPSSPRDQCWAGRVSQRSPADEAGEDHDQILTLLRQARPDGTKVEKELRRLLPLKNKAEFEPDDVAARVATKAFERAQRRVAVRSVTSTS